MQVQISAIRTLINGSPSSDLTIVVIFKKKLQVFPDIVWTYTSARYLQVLSSYKDSNTKQRLQ